MTRMPVVFIGHGTPMNAIEDNEFTRSWKEIAKRIPTPKAILSLSAHWFTKGTKIMNDEAPRTIHDMYGFPKELYEILYHCPGATKIAKLSKEMITEETEYDNSWGIDHGTWSVLVHMYPNCEIPVYQISIDATAASNVHYQIGRELRNLRDQGILLLGSGNIVHNLRILDFNEHLDSGYDWAYEFDNLIKEHILKKDHKPIINYQEFGRISKLSVPTTDHYNPLLYVLGSTYDEDTVRVYNDKCVFGSISMSSYLFES